MVERRNGVWSRRKAAVHSCAWQVFFLHSRARAAYPSGVILRLQRENRPRCRAILRETKRRGGWKNKRNYKMSSLFFISVLFFFFVFVFASFPSLARYIYIFFSPSSRQLSRVMAEKIHLVGWNLLGRKSGIESLHRYIYVAAARLSSRMNLELKSQAIACVCVLCVHVCIGERELTKEQTRCTGRNFFFRRSLRSWDFFLSLEYTRRYLQSETRG